MEDKLHNIVRNFLKRPDVFCFIGYEETVPGSTRPVFIRTQKDVKRLVWNQYCFANLTSYLPELADKKGIVGIALKPCDARAFKELNRSQQIDPDKIFKVGLPCNGLLDRNKNQIAERCYG